MAYCRVSRQSQRPDLKNQRVAREPFCTARGLANVEFVEEVGGGMNFGRKRFLALMDAVNAGEIGTLILAHQDRLPRFGVRAILPPTRVRDFSPPPRALVARARVGPSPTHHYAGLFSPVVRITELSQELKGGHPCRR